MPSFSIFDRIILGTVQLGLNYGIANTTGKPSQELANEIIKTAAQSAVFFFDTAASYGDSEAVLGKAIAANAIDGSAQVISKLPAELEQLTPKELTASISLSLHNLGLTSLYALLLHREEQLGLISAELGNTLEHLRHTNVLLKFGVSVYSPDFAISALENPFVSVIQLPASIFDRRFEQAGVFKLAEELGKEIHVRSSLLQGILCMAPAQLSTYFEPLKPALQAFRQLSAECGIDPAPLALLWVLRRYSNAKVLFGAETAKQVQKNLDLQKHSDSISESTWQRLDGIMPPQSHALLNPSLWEK